MYTITRKVGKFQFDSTTPFSLAKLICDFVQTQMLTREPQSVIVVDEISAQKYIRENTSDVLKGIDFGFTVKVVS